MAVALLSGSGEKQTKNAVRRGGSRAATYMMELFVTIANRF